jgi:cysteine desulfurase
MRAMEAKQIYMDYAATTPLDARVATEMAPFLDDRRNLFGNPGSLHGYGQTALAALDDARARLAKMFVAHRDEIIFTGSATEANNLVLRGAVRAFQSAHPNIAVPRLIVSSVEHASVLDTARSMERDGIVALTTLPVDANGIVVASALEAMLDERVAVVSCMWVNNETGMIQPIDEIARRITAYRKERKGGKWPLFHSDITQAAGLFDINVARTPVDFLTLSAHKIYGPKGVGAAYVRGGASGGTCAPIITGGSQEYGLRAGTENVVGAVGLVKALELCREERLSEVARLKKMSHDFFNRVRAAFPSLELNGDEALRAPHIINIHFPEYDRLWLALDVARVAASAGSACHQRQAIPSHVLAAMGRSSQSIARSTRFSFGRYTTQEEIDEAARRVIMIGERVK